eukprot:12431486-Karenia_brevis.AAC.1
MGLAGALLEHLGSMRSHLVGGPSCCQTRSSWAQVGLCPVGCGIWGLIWGILGQCQAKLVFIVITWSRWRATGSAAWDGDKGLLRDIMNTSMQKHQSMPLPYLCSAGHGDGFVEFKNASPVACQSASLKSTRHSTWDLC